MNRMSIIHVDMASDSIPQSVKGAVVWRDGAKLGSSPFFWWEPRYDNFRCLNVYFEKYTFLNASHDNLNPTGHS